MSKSILSGAVAFACAFAFSSARADFPTETFDGASASNAGIYAGVIPGTALEVLAGVAYIANGDPTPGRGNYLDLASGWYAPGFDTTIPGQGFTTASSVATFDLLTGYTYTLSFDYSRQTFSAGNGPFDTSLIAQLGSHSVTYADVAGFYYGYDWQTGGITWIQGANELGAHVTFTAMAPAGYSGMLVDNISMVGLAPDPIVPSPIPEPETYALMLAGLGALGWVARRRRR